MDHFSSVHSQHFAVKQTWYLPAKGRKRGVLLYLLLTLTLPKELISACSRQQQTANRRLCNRWLGFLTSSSTGVGNPITCVPETFLCALSLFHSYVFFISIIRQKWLRAGTLHTESDAFYFHVFLYSVLSFGKGDKIPEFLSLDQRVSLTLTPVHPIPKRT